MKKAFFMLAVLAPIILCKAGYAGVEADPAKDYAVTPQAGPWMVCATCYVGPEAPKLAHELVLEIRNRFNLPAWVINKGDEERKQNYARWQKSQEHLPPEMRVPYRGPRIQEQCAVLIGGYKDIDAARRALDQVKKLPPPSSNRLMPVYAEVRPVAGSEDMGEGFYRYVNPFERSFVVPNPTVPQEKHVEAKNDPFLKQLNAGESLSLLKCRKPYTLVVATFQGVSIIEPESKSNTFLSKLLPAKAPDTLSAIGVNAHNLAEALRNLRDENGRADGFDAYVLHMRNGSLVTVGGFDRQDDPEIQSVQMRLASRVQRGQNVAFLPQPFAIEVPRPK